MAVKVEERESQTLSVPAKGLVPKIRFPSFSSLLSKIKLGECAKIYDGTHQTPKYVKEGVPFYSVEHVTADDFSKTKFISEQVFDVESKRVRLEQNDILMTRIGDVGTARLIDWQVKASFYVSLALLKPSEHIVPAFLSQYLNSVPCQRQLWRRTIHAAFPKKINLGEIGKCDLIAPTLDEQEKISSFLRAIDEWIANLRAQKEKLEAYKKGMMQKIFSQEIRFKDKNGNDFPEWEEKRLGEVAQKKSSTISANTLSDDAGEYSIYGASGFLKKVDFYQESEPYIAIVKDGAGVGRLMLCEAKSSVLGTLDIVKPADDVNLYFLYLLISRIQLARYVIGSTIPHIYFSDYRRQNLFLPSRREQNTIAAFFVEIDHLIASSHSQIKSAMKWKKSLMQQMFV